MTGNSNGFMSLAMAILLVGCDLTKDKAADPGGDGFGVADVPDAIEIVEVPPTGVYLGWGWNKPDHEPIPTICVQFVEGEEPAQTRFMTMSEVSDSFEMMQSLGVSAEASVKAFGVKADGKASFAKSMNITGSSSTFVMNAEVHNGVRYAAPAPSVDGKLGARGGLEGAIRLTPEAERLASKSDRSDFVRMCGTGFVSAIYSGARLTAVLTTQTESKSEQEKLAVQMTGSGWGQEFSASVNNETGSEIKMESFDLTLFQTGGRGDAIPSTKEDLQRKLETISYEAYEAPKDFDIAITPYELLANWPKKGLETRDSEYDELASYWGAYNTLYDEIQAILEAPDEFASVTLDNSGCVVVTNDRAEAKPVDAQKLQAMVDRYPNLRDWREALAMSMVGKAEIEKYFDDSQIFYNTIREVAASYDPGTQDADRAGNLLALRDAQDEIIASLKTMEDVARECISKSDACNFKAEDYRSPYAYRLQLLPPNGFVQTGDGVVELFVEDTAKRRCSISPNNTACISNAEIADWRAKIGLTAVHKANDEGRYLELLEISKLEEYTARPLCGDGTLGSPLLSVESGQEIIWANLEELERRADLAAEIPDIDPEELQL